MITPLEKSQQELYERKYHLFGDDPRSLSWNDQPSQFLRFQRLAELFTHENEKNFSVHEIGCGLAHFKEFLTTIGHTGNYSGSDIIPAFIELSKKKFPTSHFILQSIADDYHSINQAIKDKDYYCCSGTFYTKENNSLPEWEAFVWKSIQNMFMMAKKGIACNFLTAHAGFYDEKLYYADPAKVTDWCLKNLSRFIRVLHDVPLYEFTIIIYKEDFIKKSFPDYQRYFPPIKSIVVPA